MRDNGNLTSKGKTENQISINSAATVERARHLFPSISPQRKKYTTAPFRQQVSPSKSEPGILEPVGAVLGVWTYIENNGVTTTQLMNKQHSAENIGQEHTFTTPRTWSSLRSMFSLSHTSLGSIFISGLSPKIDGQDRTMIPTPCHSTHTRQRVSMVDENKTNNPSNYSTMQTSERERIEGRRRW